MKIPKHKLVLTAAVAMTMVTGVAVADNAASSPLNDLSAVASAQMPAKAADLVLHATGKNLKQTTIGVVKAAVGLNPSAAPAIVASIAHATPNMAATASATAVAMVPDQVLAIARAAAAASPAKAGAIVEAICRVMPTAYQKVAVAVAEVVPGADKEILAGIAAAIPSLGNAINQALAGDQVNPPVSLVLNQVAPTVNVAAIASVPLGTPVSSVAGSPSTPVALPQGASVNPPAVPPPFAPKIIVPNSGSPIPTGQGRGYSAP